LTNELGGEEPRSILAKAFRGELVLQDPNDEPAESMLARRAAGPEAPVLHLPKVASGKDASVNHASSDDA
jgi:type I restriction enzyme S subunit